jgi:hypothetical protein
MLTVLYSVLLAGGFAACFALVRGCARITERRS